MIDTQGLTGMRPGEVCAMKAAYIDMNARVRGVSISVDGPTTKIEPPDVWIYTVPDYAYKLAHVENAYARKVAIGPKGQEILRPFIEGCDEDAHLFSPRDSAIEHRKKLRLDRKTPLYPAHVARHSNTIDPAIRDDYDHNTYRQAVHRACERAGVAPWNPNQIRHTRGTEIREEHGLEASSASLGHTNISTTELYAERNMKMAIRIGKQAG
jgi:integrase